MIIIVESGATKSDWRVLDDAGVQVERRLLQGTNVSSMNIEKVKEVLAEGLKEVGAVENDSLYLYTAGVMTDSIRRELTDFVLSQVRLSDIDIQNDLIGAARGALGHRTGVAAIMGTGSNACFYDGKAVSQKVFS
jgi:N-acetylglucosamine kinase-like BadF-type ATPase